MNPTPPLPNSPPDDKATLLIFGAHPDDIEFGCGGIVAQETGNGRPAHFVVCSRGEAASHGTPAERTKEAERAARILGATLEFLDLDGDAHLEERREHAIALAKIIRRKQPAIVMAPTLVENQHPDHWRLGKLVRDATRLARYGGIEELRGLQSHGIKGLFFYAIGPEGEPRDLMPILVDVSRTVGLWKEAMEAHASQTNARDYVELQMARARVNGLRANVGHAMALYPNDPLVVNSLETILPGARHF